MQVIHFDIKSANILLTSTSDDMVRRHCYEISVLPCTDI